jgi:ATP-dependent DNA ligase I
MRRFAETCEAVRSTGSKNEKIRLVSEYLRSLSVDEAALAALYFTGRPFPRSEETTLAVGSSLLWQAVSRLANASSEKMSRAYRRHGDLGDAAAEILPAQRDDQAATLTLADVDRVFREVSAARGPAPKLAALEALFERAAGAEAKYLIKIITSDLRIGLKESLVEEAIAKAFNQPLELVQRANMFVGDIGATLRLAGGGRLNEARLELFRPVGHMLASAVETAEELAESFPQGASVEDKYDGIRAQAHKQGSRVRLYSRTLDEIVEFAELATAFAAAPGNFILDGEIVGWRDGRALPFTELQQRLGRKQPELFLPLEVPVSFIAFDVLELDGQPLLDEPLRRRRACLESLQLQRQAPALSLAEARFCTSAAEFEAAFEAALARGNEGIVAKAPDSPYTPGRRGRSWLKLKRPMATLDVVVTAVEYGHGKRHGVLSDYTFSVRDGERFVTIGKAYSGLTDAEILGLTEYFQQHTLEDQGFRRTVEPSVVIEVAFQNIQRSSRHESGYALRFPRIVRLRPDKPVAEIDTLERVRELHEGQR